MEYPSSALYEDLPPVTTTGLGHSSGNRSGRGSVSFNWWQNPYNSSYPTYPCSAELAHTFGNATGLEGIAEIRPDFYAIVAGIIPLADPAASRGSFVTWEVNMTPSTPSATIIAPIPKAGMLNGMTTIEDSSLVLIADSRNRVTWHLDTISKAYSIAISDPTMLVTSSLGSQLCQGI
jgi:hypothetical protein